jgi:branched-chain amino acid transport system ATP-binding protein
MLYFRHARNALPPRAGQPGSMLQIRDLAKRFGGNRAVDGVSFDVPKGAIAGLIGPNGAGKTTLFNCVAGLFAPDAGTIALDGTRIDGKRPSLVHAAGLGRTFQIPRPFPAMSVLENVLVGVPGQSGERFWANWFSPKRVAADEKDAHEKAHAWIDFVGLGALAHEPARVLSGGQRKLLELARAMVADPRLVLLDEPAAGVNPALLEKIIERIVEINRGGTTFLIVEHNMDMVMRLCHPIAVMAQGKLIAFGDAAGVRGNANVVDAYLGGAAA